MNNADFVPADPPWTRSLQVFEKSWEYAKEVYTCIVDLQKPYDYVSRDKLWAVLLEYDMRGQLLAAIKLLYKQSEVYIFVSIA